MLILILSAVRQDGHTKQMERPGIFSLLSVLVGVVTQIDGWWLTVSTTLIFTATIAPGDHKVS